MNATNPESRTKMGIKKERKKERKKEKSPESV